MGNIFLAFFHSEGRIWDIIDIGKEAEKTPESLQMIIRAAIFVIQVNFI